MSARIDTLYFIVFASTIVGLIFGSELVRWLMAGVLVLGVLPFWGALRQFFQRQFWRDVENIIAASDEQPPKEPPSVRE